MAGTDVTGDGELLAGDFSSWLQEVQAAIRGQGTADVPCGECTACCTSAQFVHIAPDETEALDHIPRRLLFPAPGLPRGHVLLGYDEHGHCPMLVDNRCSIYEHRPRTCRTYDCRVFPAAGLDLDGDDAKAGIARRVGRWRFSYPTSEDRDRHDAVRTAAAFLAARPDVPPPGAAPRNTTELAVLAVRVHEAFLGRDGATPDPEAVGAEVRRLATSHPPSGL